jgi:hypothetical protein
MMNTNIVKYDFGSVITSSDQDKAKNQIQQIIQSGQYFQNSPKYQTQVNLFGIQDDVWLKFRFSFIFSAFMYLGKEVSIHNLQAWSFMTNNEIEEDRSNLWHTHQYTPGKTTVSGIYYLHIPGDADLATSGTEFAPNGIDRDERITATPTPYSWIIYPGKLYHRPTPPQSKEYRFVIAADMEF